MHPQIEPTSAHEDEMRAVVENLPELAWSAEANGSITFYNRRWYDYTGTTLEEMQGWGWEKVHDPAILPRVVERWQRSLATGDPFEMEFPLRRADGVFRWFLTRVTPIRDKGGRITRWVGVNVDVDDKRRASQERELFAARMSLLARGSELLSASLDVAESLQSLGRMLLESIATSVSIHLITNDSNDRELSIILDRDAQMEASCHNLHRRSHFHHGHAVSVGIRKVHAQIFNAGSALEESIGGGVYESPAAFEALRLTSTMVAPLVVRGAEIGTISVGKRSSTYNEGDLAFLQQLASRASIAVDNSRLYESARRDRVSAEQANRAKDEFLAMVSHELRTPLNAMLGWTRLLRAGDLDPDRQVKALDTIERNAVAQAQLIEDLLDISSIITGKLRLDVKPVDLIQVVEAALETVRPAADAKGVRLQAILDPSAGRVSGDGDRLQQVVWNVLSNAVKFTPKGGRVHVRLTSNESSAEIVVEDTGPGIEPEFLPFVFERFRQAEPGTSRGHGGLGLGLAIVKHIVELHGGTVSAASDGTGLGATFSIQIPVAPVRISRPPPSLSSVTHASASQERFDFSSQIGGLRVLVVDDEPDARELLVAMLERCSVVVETASTAGEAFEKLTSMKPDVLLSDIGMPHEDGYSLIQKVRTLPAGEGGRTPAVALTAYARMEDRTRAMLAGFTMHVSKPIELAELVVVIANVAGRLAPRSSQP